MGFRGVGGEICDGDAWRGEDMDLMMFLREDCGDLAGGEAGCVCEEDLHFWVMLVSIHVGFCLRMLEFRASHGEGEIYGETCVSNITSEPPLMRNA